MLITICKMLSHHFLIHSLLGIPTSAPCHYCGLVTACEANSISNEEISGLWECIHVQVVSKHHLNEPNFALDPKYHLIPMRASTPTLTQRQTFSEHLLKSIQMLPDYISSVLPSLFFVFSLSNLEWFLEIENQNYQSSIQNSQPRAKPAADTGAQKR